MPCVCFASAEVGRSKVESGGFVKGGYRNFKNFDEDWDDQKNKKPAHILTKYHRDACTSAALFVNSMKSGTNIIQLINAEHAKAVEDNRLLVKGIFRVKLEAGLDYA